MERLADLVRSVQDNHRVIYWTTRWEERQMTLMLARLAVCLYFINLGFTSVEILLYGVEGSPVVGLVTLACSALLLLNKFSFACGCILLCKAGWDVAAIMLHQVAVWLDGSPLYVNELMVKMLAVLGAMCLLLARDDYFKALKSSSAIAGLLLSGPSSKETSTKRSLVLLLARTTMSTLFIFVGYSELQRQLAPPQMHGDHAHSRPAGDGHDNLWPKLIEFVLALPLAVGFKTLLVARSLAAVLFFEAFVYWRFWESLLGFGYVLHARQHFTVNVAVAGGLLLLQEMGGGKYSVDELLKKRD